jgi:predicted thioesterase
MALTDDPRGRQARTEHVVTGADTAAALGSGDLDVLATPRLLAWMEAATCAALQGVVDEQDTTVGTRVAVEHLRGSAVGEPIAVTATVAHVDGRLLRFEVVAEDSDGAVVAHGEITRIRVDRARFLERLPAR